MLALFLVLTWSRLVAAAVEDSTDLAKTPLLDGRRGELLTTWGGAVGVGNTQGIRLQWQDAPAKRRAVCIELANVPAAESRFLQCLAAGFGPSAPYYQTRDLGRYQRLELSMRNATKVRLCGSLQLKDYRDSGAHSAVYRFDLPATTDWTRIDVSLDLGQVGWTCQGEPDLSRILSLDFIFQPQARITAGQIYLEDIVLVEPGGPVPVSSSPLAVLVERLAHRQWDALWAARSRTHGMIPNNSYQSTDAGLNTTAAVLWMLPAATRHHWIQRAAADRYVDLLLRTTGQLFDRARHLPPRNVDWVTLKPSLLPEESSVDAAFLALALHQYKSLPSTAPALRQAIDRVQERFDFAAFACPTGWRMAYRYPTRSAPEGFVHFIYDGYTNEGNLISLAAHLSKSHHVPIETYWNTNVNRARVRLCGQQGDPVVHSVSDFRAPYAQALLNLFVDVRRRGVDNYPDNRLAVNPWQNFVCYEKSVMAKLVELGRPHLVQPDAGDDGTLTNYRQFSLYESFGQRDLFMPWSAAFALLAGVDGAEDTLRFLLEHQLHDSLGLVDSAKWATGTPEPYAITARHDFWNTSMATMAMLEWLDGESRESKTFAALPEVHVALDHVFRPRESIARLSGTEPAPTPVP